MNLEYIIQADDNYKDVNQVLKNKFNISTRLLTKLIKKQKILLNNIITDTRNKVNIDDVVTVLFDYEEDNSNIFPTKMDLKIIYEDECLLIVNKPADIPVHPSIAHYDNSLSNGVKFYFDQIGLKKKIRPVNRLDKDTSGIVIFAKNEYIQECLINQMSNNTFKKDYVALISGILDQKKRNYR